MTDSAIVSPRTSFQTSRVGVLPYALTIFLSAALIFLVQPMFAKMVLPILGGAPSVWNVTLVCFQAALLLGYLYAHLLSRLASLRLQIIIHAIVVIMAASVLPLGLTGMLGDPDPHRPALWLSAAFALSIAPPFTALSATAPLIQSWYSRSGRPDAADPYYLYGASNIGSIIGLVAYPVLLEPLMSLSGQSFVWSSAYVLVGAALIACGWLAFNTGRHAGPNHTAGTVEDCPAPNWRERLTWLTLAFVPSSLLVGATTHITTDVAAGPFLWAPPLIAYIGSFIIVFSKAGPRATRWAVSVAPYVTAALLLFLCHNLFAAPLLPMLLLNITMVLVAGLVCHGTLAARRPSTAHLTEFYLIMSLGGVIGGAFNALLAPVLFNDVVEYPLVLLALLVLLPGTRGTWQRKDLAIATLSVLAVLAALAVTSATDRSGAIGALYILLVMPIVMMLISKDHRYLPTFAGALAYFGSGIVSAQHTPTLATERGFFGVVSVDEVDGLRRMIHGTTVHGAQYTDEVGRPTPLMYYHPDTPIGQAYAAFADKPRTGAVGLGVGASACLLSPNQSVTFFEIDPVVVRTAQNTDWFTFLSQCAPEAPIVLGDGRLTLMQASPASLDLLLIDAFSSDVVPTHLLTREAMRGYVSRLSDDGVLIFHISNRYMDLEPVLARIAEAEGLVMRAQRFQPDHAGDGLSILPTHAVVLARATSDLAALDTDARWRHVQSDGGRPWTDDYINMLGVLLAHQK
ncbi:fused MFS/spermidine synthase [Parvularcula sp. LCG005]|uniref:fused MFS/spermidine synthase n=1 Tax=Parvularcula sp. LCG005 TaxID=3078805 RepID=UPI0029425950|nr:fused MFS/spermidine synthase [Parvularcula sp. LCG005]WOI54360.1 fused MFS/spermidine synthase [Parvularcula sp. LCG005]